MEPKDKPLFVIDPNPTVDWPVVVRLPADGGMFEEYQFTAKIRVLSAAEYAALSEVTAPPVAAEENLPMTMLELLQDNARKFGELVVGWQGPTDKDGKAVPFSPEVLTEQITGPHGAGLSAGLWVAIREIRSGTRLGNSAPPSVAG